MDSSNSGSISSSGDEEHDSRSSDHTQFLNHLTHQFPSSFVNSSSHFHQQPSLFDLSSTYLHAFPHQQNSFLNLDAATSSSSSRPRRISEPHHCTAEPPGLVPSSSVTAPPPSVNQCLPTPQDNARILPSQANPARNPKKRTRASRRAPTTVLTTDTTNFRAMVQEFTGIPAPPFSGSSYSRRLDLLTASRSVSSHHHFDATTPFYPLRPSPPKFPNPSTLLSSFNNNAVDAIASSTATNISPSCNNNNNLVNHQLPPDLAVPYHYHHVLGTQNDYPPSTTTLLHPPFGNALSFAAKPQGTLSVLEDFSVSHVSAQVGVTVPTGHGHVTSDEANDDGRCKLNFGSGSGTGSADEKRLEKNHNHNSNNNNTNSSTSRGEGTTIDSWICSSDN